MPLPSLPRHCLPGSPRAKNPAPLHSFPVGHPKSKPIGQSWPRLKRHLISPLYHTTEQHPALSCAHEAMRRPTSRARVGAHSSCPGLSESVSPLHSAPYLPRGDRHYHHQFTECTQHSVSVSYSKYSFLLCLLLSPQQASKSWMTLEEKSGNV